MDLISIYDAFFYKYTKCREQVALKGLNVQPGPNKGKKCVTDFTIWQLRKV